MGLYREWPRMFYVSSSCFKCWVFKWKNLDDFHSRSCWTPLCYVTLWIHLFISGAVYAVDAFVAINLLIFSKWPDTIKPALPFNFSRWVFVACFIVSSLLLAFRYLHTTRVIKSGSIAESYLDPLTVRVQSIQLGQRGRGWKRFLVYVELTKSKKGTDYVALFSYFSFNGEQCVWEFCQQLMVLTATKLGCVSFLQMDPVKLSMLWLYIQ